MKEIKTFRAWFLMDVDYEPFNVGFSEEFECAGEMWVIHRPGSPGNFLSHGWRVSHKETGSSVGISANTKPLAKRLAEDKINSRLADLPDLIAKMKARVDDMLKARKTE